MCYKIWWYRKSLFWSRSDSKGLAHRNTGIIVSMKITKPYNCEFLVNSLTFAIRIFWYHLMQINLPMIILGQMIVFCNWFHWKFNNFTQKISTFIPICFEKLFALFASVCLQTILFAEKCKQFLFANNLQSIISSIEIFLIYCFVHFLTYIHDSASILYQTLIEH